MSWPNRVLDMQTNGHATHAADGSTSSTRGLTHIIDQLERSAP